MAKIDLTDKRLAALKPKAATFELMDRQAPGLGIRVHPTGSRVWVLKSRFPPNKNPVRRSLGTYPDLSLEAARTVAREWRGMIRAGIDPALEKARQDRAAEAAREGSFDAVAERFVAQHVAKLADGRAVERMVRNELMARWAGRPIAEISRSDVIAMVEDIAERAPARARNTFATARSLFAFATERGLLESSPAERVRVARLVGPMVARDRVLTDDELRSLWSACDALSYPYGPIFRLLLLTGCRKSEVAEARWIEFDLDARTWIIPAARAKTDSVHVVPLSDMAIAVLEALPRHAGSDLVFTLSGALLNSFDSAKAKLDKLMDHPSPPFVIHDLRRTVRTQLSALGIPTTVAELCLGHAQKGLHAVYDRHSFTDEKRAALNTWAARLRGIVDPPAANVVKLRIR